ncbi:MAG: cytochrome c oxidase accessory protein CcoG [Bdellovibrionales bacterium]|nr:cytochrome c oxidase accessory protein CcoG [Bdellovibrionales bacterium]
MGVDHRTRSLDEEGHHRAIHPTEVRGKWHSRRAVVQYILIAFFLVLPWISIGGRPLLLLDIFDRRFSVLGVVFQAHDVPLLFLFVIGFVLVVGLLTALFGRVWCGWACPQTVFVEGVFRRIEGWIEGNAFERRKAAAAGWSAERVGRAVAKWTAYFAVTLVITHSFLALFVGPEKLGAMIAAGPDASPRAFLFVLVSSAIILFDFGWFREQFCIVACPYGRIQSVFQDTKTRTVAYDANRGEPRGPIRKESVAGPRGDCVDCSRCVQVCPTGIDIRNGSSQLECIACTACMDACDEVMTRTKRPPGLIRYVSLEELETRRPTPTWRRGRTLLYLVPLAIVVAAVVGIGESRTLAMVEIFKVKGAPYATYEDGSSRGFGNLFMAEVAGRTNGKLRVAFSLDTTAGGGAGKAGAEDVELVMPNNPIEVGEGELLRQPFTVRFSRAGLVDGKREIALRIEASAASSGPGNPGREVQTKKVVLIGPL